MIGTLKHLAVCAATVGMTVTPCVSRATDQAAPSAARAIDVQLNGNTLHGRVVSAAGVPASTTVVVLRGTQELARTEADDQGRYQIHDLATGTYTVATATSAQSVRLWSHNAPKNACQECTIQQGTTVRGNGMYGYGGGSSLLPIGIAAAALATTIAVTQANDDNPVVNPATP